MIPELGQFALILALCLAFVQATVPLVGAVKEQLPWMRVAKFTSVGQCFFIACAFAALAYAFLTNDFSVTYVAENSNRHLPTIYRFCAVWGAHEGSLLLWVFILSIWTCAVALFSNRLPVKMQTRVLAVLAMISFGFLLFLLLTSNPFARLLPNFPADGHDLNPLLQDPGLVIHPPILYMGYVGFSVPFAFAIAVLLSGRFDAAWARWVRPWVLITWCFLTWGITLGSWWSYRELGWGGWWFWDPVENASFLPWLVGTALVHSLIVTEKRQAFKAWTVLLAICAFSLSLLGTFLVRSGVLVSVHAFAIDPSRGDFLLSYLAWVVGCSFVLYAWRGYLIRGSSEFSLCSRETFLLANNVFLTVAMATVLLGTLYPLIIQTLDLGKISVGAPYFNAVFIPLMAPMFFLMAIAPQVHWHEMSPASLVKRLRFTFLTAIISTVLLVWFASHTMKPAVLLGVGLALWIILATLQSLFTSAKGMPKFKKLSLSHYGMVFAHIGIAICIIGIVCSSNYSVERDVRMQPNDSVTVGPYQFQFLGVSGMKGPNYTAIQAGVLVSQQGKVIILLRPEQRIFNVQQIALSKTAIDVGVFRDLYVALGGPIGNHNAWSLRIYYKPFVRWIWLGGLLIVLGGILAILGKRKRL
jgi:cytochrome c-type biogenesis protein CcmF